ncbi:transmembrane protein, putative [Medicago truncatula]|uniref:Transmembrane protein, putative n=1 Tax=Medicago truncatula TaxID=3880 RepID=A0A072UMZ5_MEDTR|nr:transmembrane protein, putative [Medicago truncatula]
MAPTFALHFLSLVLFFCTVFLKLGKRFKNNLRIIIRCKKGKLCIHLHTITGNIRRSMGAP